MSHEPLDMPQGTVDLLVLRILALGPHHGWSIAERLHQLSSAALRIKQGSLYPALHRLERRGWLKAEWRPSDNTQRAKYYELTRKGRAQLETEASAWQKLTAAVSLILEIE